MTRVTLARDDFGALWASFHRGDGVDVVLPVDDDALLLDQLLNLRREARRLFALFDQQIVLH